MKKKLQKLKIVGKIQNIYIYINKQSNTLIFLYYKSIWKLKLFSRYPLTVLSVASMINELKLSWQSFWCTVISTPLADFLYDIYDEPLTAFSLPLQSSLLPIFEAPWVGWSDISIYVIFENGHIAVDFYEFNSKKLANLAARAAKISF